MNRWIAISKSSICFSALLILSRTRLTLSMRMDYSISRVSRILAGCPGFRFLVPGPWGQLGSSPFLGFQPLTLDFQLLIPDRYFFSAKSFQYYRILLHSYY